MLNTTLRRAVTVTCAVAATGTMVMTTAVTANAAPRVSTQAAAQAGVLILANSTPLNTGRVRVVYTGEHRQVQTAPSVVAIPGQSLLRLGLTTAKAAAGNGRAYGCSGILGQGGTFQVGADGTTCQAVYPGSGGVSLDLGSLTSALPVGVGNISLLLNGITANARYVDGAVSGVGRLDNAQLSVCLGLTLNGACVGAPVVVPLRLRGTVNEDVVTTIVNTLTATPALAAVATTLSNALRAAVNLRTNVQVTDPTNGVLKVTGLKLILLQRAGAVTALGIAQAGPGGGPAAAAGA